MKDNKKYRLVKKSLACILLATTITGCTKDVVVDCDIKGNHVHLYQNTTNGILRYIEGESEKKGDFVRKDDYVEATPKTEAICENNLCLIADNFDYFEDKVNSVPAPKIQAYVYKLVYGTYYGYGYGYSFTSGKYEYGYGLMTGYHYDYEWEDISFDTYTTDEVRDITYQIKLYKVNDDGTVVYKLFNQEDDIDSDYAYFNSKDLITECVSDSYYLEKNKTKAK